MLKITDLFHRVIRNNEFYKAMRRRGMFRYIPSDMPIEKCLVDCKIIKDSYNPPVYWLFN